MEPSVKKSEAVVAAVVDDRPPWEPRVEAVVAPAVHSGATEAVEAAVELAVEAPLEQYAALIESSVQPSIQPSIQKPVPTPEPAETAVPSDLIAASPSADVSAEVAATPDPVVPAPIALERFTPENWIQLRRQLTIGASLGEIASHCLYLGRDGQCLKFLIDSDHNSLYDDAHQQQFSDALSDYFQQPVTVEITLGVAKKETPRAATTREKAERLVEAVESLHQDPAVAQFKQRFDGLLDERTVKPID